jgi:hypothetical protein
MTDEQRIRIATAAVEKSIQEYERRIKEFDVNPKKTEGKTPETPELKKLRERRQLLKNEVEVMNSETNPGKSPEEVALQAYKTRLTNRKAELEEKLANKDFAKKPQRKTVPDMEAMKLQDEVLKVKEAFDKERYKFERANRTKPEKVMDWLVRWRRELILTGVPTLGKLTVAASARIGISPIEEMYGGLISKIPGISAIADKAPREGGFSGKAEAESLSKLFQYDTLDQMLKIIKEGKSREDRLFGKKADLPNEAFEFFGRVHSALKYSAKRAEIYRAFQKRAEYAWRKGIDPSDPLVEATLWADAYIDGSRSIFMNDNMATDLYRSMLGYLRNKKGGKPIAAVAQILLPIVKVPTNFVLETTHYAFGLPKAAAAIAHGLVKGMDNMTPQEADYIMRMLKKGSVGLALFTVGFLNPQAIGGYYNGKRKEDDLDANDLKFFGIKIPHWAQHIPPIEVLQLGATVRRVKDAYEKKHTDAKGAAEGLRAGVVGLLSETPFIDQPKRLGKAFSSLDNMKDYAGDLGSSMVVPMGLKNIADLVDNQKDAKGEDVKRKPVTFLDYFKQGVPGLRQQVPTKEEAAKMKKKGGGLSSGLTGGLR